MGAVACASEAQSQCSFLSPSILSCRPSTPPPSASSTWPTCFGRRRASAWAACPLGRACRTRRASRGSGEKGRKTRGVEVRGQPSLSLFFHDPPFRARTHTHIHKQTCQDGSQHPDALRGPRPAAPEPATHPCRRPPGLPPVGPWPGPVKGLHPRSARPHRGLPLRRLRRRHVQRARNGRAACGVPATGMKMEGDGERE